MTNYLASEICLGVAGLIQFITLSICLIDADKVPQKWKTSLNLNAIISGISLIGIVGTWSILTLHKGSEDEESISQATQGEILFLSTLCVAVFTVMLQSAQFYYVGKSSENGSPYSSLTSNGNANSNNSLNGSIFTPSNKLLKYNPPNLTTGNGISPIVNTNTNTKTSENLNSNSSEIQTGPAAINSMVAKAEKAAKSVAPMTLPANTNSALSLAATASTLSAGPAAASTTTPTNAFSGSAINYMNNFKMNISGAMSKVGIPGMKFDNSSLPFNKYLVGNKFNSDGNNSGNYYQPLMENQPIDPLYTDETTYLYNSLVIPSFVGMVISVGPEVLSHPLPAEARLICTLLGLGILICKPLRNISWGRVAFLAENFSWDLDGSIMTFRKMRCIAWMQWFGLYFIIGGLLFRGAAPISLPPGFGYALSLLLVTFDAIAKSTFAFAIHGAAFNCKEHMYNLKVVNANASEERKDELTSVTNKFGGICGCLQAMFGFGGGNSEEEKTNATSSKDNTITTGAAAATKSKDAAGLGKGIENEIDEDETMIENAVETVASYFGFGDTSGDGSDVAAAAAKAKARADAKAKKYQAWLNAHPWMSRGELTNGEKSRMEEMGYDMSGNMKRDTNSYNTFKNNRYGSTGLPDLKSIGDSVIMCNCLQGLGENSPCSDLNNNEIDDGSEKTTEQQQSSDKSSSGQPSSWLKTLEGEAKDAVAGGKSEWTKIKGDLKSEEKQVGDEVAKFFGGGSSDKKASSAQHVDADLDVNFNDTNTTNSQSGPKSIFDMISETFFGSKAYDVAINTSNTDRTNIGAVLPTQPGYEPVSVSRIISSTTTKIENPSPMDLKFGGSFLNAKKQQQQQLNMQQGLTPRSNLLKATEIMLGKELGLTDEGDASFRSPSADSAMQNAAGNANNKFTLPSMATVGPTPISLPMGSSSSSSAARSMSPSMLKTTPFQLKEWTPVSQLQQNPLFMSSKKITSGPGGPGGPNKFVKAMK